MKEGHGREALRIWLAIVGSATLVLGASYAMVRQSARMAVNDAPVQAVRDAKQKLDDGKSPKEIIPKVETDLRTGNGVFVIITDSATKVLASSAILDDEAPLPPRGVFEHAKDHGTDSFTWEPKEGVRHATEVLEYDIGGGGFIVAGQSLEQVEKRVATYNLIAFTAFAAIIVWTMLILFPQSRRLHKKSKVASIK